MIRIIHTADWHIGQTLAGYPREGEHRAVLKQLETVVAERQADALIVAGDVFDSQNPSGEAQRLFFDTLVALKRARPKMTIVVTAGNHDAAGRLEAPHALLGAIGVHVVGSVRRVEERIDISRHLIDVTAADGEIGAQVLALSYPTAACLRSLNRGEGEEGSPIVRATADLYREAFKAACPLLQLGVPLIVTGHLHVAGGTESEGAERRILVGGEHAISPEMFPAEAAYVALGHLHKPQTFDRAPGKGPIVRYSGSLFPLSASEQPYKHGVTLLTLGAGAPLVEHIELTRPVPFLRVPQHGECDLEQLPALLTALELSPHIAGDARPYVQVRLQRKGLPAGFRAELDRIADPFPIRLVDVRLTPLAGTVGLAAAPDEICQLSERAPVDLFVEAFQKALGEAPGPAHLDVFNRALMSAEAEG